VGVTQKELIEKLKESLKGEIEVFEAFNEINIRVKRDYYLETIKKLKYTFNFDLLIDLTAVDEGDLRVVVHLYSLKDNLRVRVSSKVGEDMSMPSIFSLYKGANWLEREVFDLFGINFNGHPNLKRILLWEGFPGHPLRKSYPLGKRPPMPEPK
jgi:NADH-quinone oxidoreductase subunit C